MLSVSDLVNIGSIIDTKPVSGIFYDFRAVAWEAKAV